MRPASPDALAQTVAAALAHDPEGIVGLAVSGGGDSMAMLHLFASLAPSGRLRVVTVDHDLRPGSAEEAGFVARICAGLGVPHQTLLWDHGGRVQGNLEAAARSARYRLIAGWARGQGVPSVAVAHTAEDQAETFLMGLTRAAGLDGLAGMRPEWEHGGMRFRRPLLAHRRAELRDWLSARGLDWREDPMNADPRFARVRARRLLEGLAPLGLDAGRIAESQRHLAAAQALLRQHLVRDLARIGVEVEGALILDRAGFADLPPEAARQLLIAALLWLNRADHAPRAAEVGRLVAALSAGRDATLAGCRARVVGPQIRLCREPWAVAGPLPVLAGRGQLWDGRWIVGPPGDMASTGCPESGSPAADNIAPTLEIRALGAEGLRLCPDWRETGLPREVLIVSPAIWAASQTGPHADPETGPHLDPDSGPDAPGPRLVAAPLAGKSAGWTARIDRSLSEFIISH